METPTAFPTPKSGWSRHPTTRIDAYVRECKTIKSPWDAERSRLASLSLYMQCINQTLRYNFML